jgi:hypothetical protein
MVHFDQTKIKSKGPDLVAGFNSLSDATHFAANIMCDLYTKVVVTVDGNEVFVVNNNSSQTSASR